MFSRGVARRPCPSAEVSSIIYTLHLVQRIPVGLVMDRSKSRLEWSLHCVQKKNIVFGLQNSLLNRFRIKIYHSCSLEVVN